MLNGFVVIAWLLMPGTAPVPFASMVACEAAAKALNGKQNCVGTGALDQLLSILNFAMSVQADHLPSETAGEATNLPSEATVKYAKELLGSGVLNEHQRKAIQQMVDAAGKHRLEKAEPLEGGAATGELDAIRRHIEPCWNLPPGVRDAQNMAIEIRATVGLDGRV